MSSGSSPNYSFAHVSPNSANPEVAVNGTFDSVDTALKGVDDRVALLEEGGGGGTGLPPGGTTGQFLAKTSNADGDADWYDAPAGGSGGDTVIPQYRRYRFLMKAGSVNGGYGYSLSEMSFLDSKGKPISLSGIEVSSLGAINGYVAANLFDGNAQTYFNHSPGGGENQNLDTWVSVVFPQNVDIRKISITSRADQGAVNDPDVAGKQVPRQIIYQYATDAAPVSWVDVTVFGGGLDVPNYAPGETRTFAVPSVAVQSGDGTAPVDAFLKPPKAADFATKLEPNGAIITIDDPDDGLVVQTKPRTGDVVAAILKDTPGDVDWSLEAHIELNTINVNYHGVGIVFYGSSGLYHIFASDVSEGGSSVQVSRYDRAGGYNSRAFYFNNVQNYKYRKIKYVAAEKRLYFYVSSTGKRWHYLAFIDMPFGNSAPQKIGLGMALNYAQRDNNPECLEELSCRYWKQSW